MGGRGEGVVGPGILAVDKIEVEEYDEEGATGVFERSLFFRDGEHGTRECVASCV